ncbi:MAG: PQQ-like beta-propeller repeat protein, partial [Pirellulales bacterium]|nr:PQQ-like beta-propeller repeat protein [Pirellulales bacterium]
MGTSILQLAFGIALGALLLVIVACGPPAADVKHPGTAEGGRAANVKLDGAWPLFRGDPAATGMARCDLPAEPELLWTFSTDDGGFEATAVIADSMVYVGSTDGRLYAVRLDNGKKSWDYPTELGFVTAPGVYDGRVYIGDDDGRFHCLDAKTGKLIWKHDAEAEINSAANFYRGNVLFGSQDSVLYCLDAKTGKLIWKFQSNDQIRCSPSIVGNRAFVAGCDGELHVVDLEKGTQTKAVPLDSPTGSTPALTAAGKTSDGRSSPGMA